MVLTITIAVALIASAYFLWLHFSVQQEVKRQLHTLAEASCPACSAKFGVSAAERARNEHIQHCAEVRKQQPNLRINFARKWEIACPSCGKIAEFSYETFALSQKAA